MALDIRHSCPGGHSHFDRRHGRSSYLKDVRQHDRLDNDSDTDKELHLQLVANVEFRFRTAETGGCEERDGHNPDESPDSVNSHDVSRGVLPPAALENNCIF